MSILPQLSKSSPQKTPHNPEKSRSVDISPSPPDRGFGFLECQLMEQARYKRAGVSDEAAVGDRILPSENECPYTASGSPSILISGRGTSEQRPFAWTGDPDAKPVRTQVILEKIDVPGHFALATSRSLQWQCPESGPVLKGVYFEHIREATEYRWHPVLFTAEALGRDRRKLWYVPEIQGKWLSFAKKVRRHGGRFARLKLEVSGELKAPSTKFKRGAKDVLGPRQSYETERYAAIVTVPLEGAVPIQDEDQLWGIINAIPFVRGAITMSHSWSLKAAGHVRRQKDPGAPKWRFWRYAHVNAAKTLEGYRKEGRVVIGPVHNLDWIPFQVPKKKQAVGHAHLGEGVLLGRLEERHVA